MNQRRQSNAIAVEIVVRSGRIASTQSHPVDEYQPEWDKGDPGYVWLGRFIHRHTGDAQRDCDFLQSIGMQDTPNCTCIINFKAVMFGHVPDANIFPPDSLHITPPTARECMVLLSPVIASPIPAHMNSVALGVG